MRQGGITDNKNEMVIPAASSSTSSSLLNDNKKGLAKPPAQSRNTLSLAITATGTERDNDKSDDPYLHLSPTRRGWSALSQESRSNGAVKKMSGGRNVLPTAASLSLDSSTHSSSSGGIYSSPSPNKKKHRRKYKPKMNPFAIGSSLFGGNSKNTSLDPPPPHVSDDLSFSTVDTESMSYPSSSSASYCTSSSLSSCGLSMHSTSTSSSFLSSPSSPSSSSKPSPSFLAPSQRRPRRSASSGVLSLLRRKPSAIEEESAEQQEERQSRPFVTFADPDTTEFIPGRVFLGADISLDESSPLASSLSSSSSSSHLVDMTRHEYFQVTYYSRPELARLARQAQQLAEDAWKQDRHVVKCLHVCYGFRHEQTPTNKKGDPKNEDKDALTPEKALQYYFYYQAKEDQDTDQKEEVSEDGVDVDDDAEKNATNKRRNNSSKSTTTTTTLRGLEWQLSSDIADQRMRCIQSVLALQHEWEQQRRTVGVAAKSIEWLDEALHKQSSANSHKARKFARLLAKGDAAIVLRRHASEEANSTKNKSKCSTKSSSHYKKQLGTTTISRSPRKVRNNGSGHKSSTRSLQ